jgi:hypothetical protein
MTNKRTTRRTTKGCTPPTAKPQAPAMVDDAKVEAGREDPFTRIRRKLDSDKRRK